MNIKNIVKIFESKLESTPEEENRREISEYLESIEAISEKEWIPHETKVENYQYVAKEILELLPENVLVFELSADVYAKRDFDKKQIEDEEIKDLEWVQNYAKNR